MELQEGEGSGTGAQVKEEIRLVRMGDDHSHHSPV